jgi:hypothetical protein
MNRNDFSRSFLKFTTNHAQHTPRLQVDALCTFHPAGGAPLRYALTSPCICETMYAPADLVQRPPAVFLMIASTEEYMMIKDFAGARPDAREPRRVGEAMSTHDGKGSTMLRIEIDRVEFPRVRKIESYEDIREAILGNRVLIGRTTFADADGARVELDYPIRVCNIPHTRRGWQVDTGPVLFPQGAPGGSLVARLAPAYVVYNAWDWAEFAILRLNTPGAPAAPAAQFTDIRRLAVVNEIFRVE